MTLTIVMYHYVREIGGSRHPNIKGLEFEGFRRQLDHLSERYEVVSGQAVVEAVKGGERLPENACLLTFDDGYRDHFDYVAPELSKRGLTGAFFPPVKSTVRREMLDVNAIHFILDACDADIPGLVRDLRAALRAHLGEAEVEAAYARHATAGRYDTADVMFVKRMLQHVLPEATRAAIVKDLFERHVGRDMGDFAAELYISADEARQMVEAGMTVGGHGDAHVWLDRETREAQARELDASRDLLKSIGVAGRDWIMCYPYGAYNADTLELLAERECAVGLTTRVAVADLEREPPLELSRMNTNDFPQ